MNTNGGNGKVKDFIERVKKLRSLPLGQKDVIPILAVGEKKPPTWFNWTEYRDGMKPPLTDEQLDTVFSNPDVGRAAILLSKVSFLIDAEGEGLAVQGILEYRMSEGLRQKVRTTRTTITPNGRHKHLLLSPNAYPDGIEELLCWSLGTEGGNKPKQNRKKGEHAPGSGEVRVLSQSKYVIEVGAGYEVLSPGHEIAIELNEGESREIVELYTSFKEQHDVIRMMIGGERKESLLKYWTAESNRRHDIAMGLAGTCWYTKVPETFVHDLVYYVCKVTKDEELDDRLRAVRDVYAYGGAGNKDVKGIGKLLPALDGNKEIIQKLYEGLETLGYKITRTSVTFKGSDVAKKYFGSVDDIDVNTQEGLGGLKGSKADTAIDVCMPYIKELFVDKFDVAFATVETEQNRLETLGIKRGKFKAWMRNIFYESQGEALNQTTMDTAVGTLEAKAMFSKKKKLLAIRVSDGRTDISGTADTLTSPQIVTNEPIRMYYDLTNSKSQVIETTSEGWSIKESNQVPQMFYRLQGQQPQVMPTKDYPENIMDQFMDLTNTIVKDANGAELPGETRKMRLLLKCYVIGLFIPNISRVILLLYGEQGSAKTAFLELVKMLVDPSGALTLTFPRSMAEIVQQLSHNFIAYYDNVSVIRDWLSDVICRAATGTGFTKRQLYTDDDDIIYEFIRSVGISAIHLPGSKPDMLSRSLIAKFSFISKDLRRKYKEDILPIFNQIRPQVLGYVFDILAKAVKIKEQGGIQLDTRERMADWEEWCEIIARCVGYKPMEFINAYTDNTKLQSELVLEDRPVARALVKLVESLDEGKDEEWAGYNTKLLGVLDEVAATQLDLNTKTEKLWPKSASALSRRLSEIRPTLRELGIEIYETKDSRTRIKTIHIRKRHEVRKMPSVPLLPPESATNQEFEGENTRSHDPKTGGVSDSISGNNKLPLYKTPDSTHKDPTLDGTNDTSDILHTSSSSELLYYFNIDEVEIVNIRDSRCDAYIGREWKDGYGFRPLIGGDGDFGNPFVILKPGQKATKPWQCKTRKEELTNFDKWLNNHSTEVVNGYDPKEYRARALKDLPGCHKWGCHCKPEACHGDVLKKYVKRQLQIQRAHANEKLKRKAHKERESKGGE